MLICLLNVILKVELTASESLSELLADLFAVLWFEHCKKKVGQQFTSPRQHMRIKRAHTNLQNGVTVVEIQRSFLGI